MGKITLFGPNMHQGPATKSCIDPSWSKMSTNKYNIFNYFLAFHMTNLMAAKKLGKQRTAIATLFHQFANLCLSLVAVVHPLSLRLAPPLDKRALSAGHFASLMYQYQFLPPPSLPPPLDSPKWDTSNQHWLRICFWSCLMDGSLCCKQIHLYSSIFFPRTLVVFVVVNS